MTWIILGVVVWLICTFPAAILVGAVNGHGRMDADDKRAIAFGPITLLGAMLFAALFGLCCLLDYCKSRIKVSKIPNPWDYFVKLGAARTAQRRESE